ncbi:MAG: hypothetical protein K8R44_03845 [Sulfurimonas sp.]|nr:hypothetical protein [Sulfurimonas sp.]
MKDSKIELINLSKDINAIAKSKSGNLCRINMNNFESNFVRILMDEMIFNEDILDKQSDEFLSQIPKVIVSLPRIRNAIIDEIKLGKSIPKVFSEIVKYDCIRDLESFISILEKTSKDDKLIITEKSNLEEEIKNLKKLHQEIDFSDVGI